VHRAFALDVADAVEAFEPEAAVGDREGVTVERSRTRTRGAVALLVELAAVTRAAEAAGRQRRNDVHLAVRLRLGAMLSAENRPVRLRRTADVRAPARHRREARQPFQQSVVADVGGASRHRAPAPGVGEEGRDDEATLGERVDRSEVDRTPPLTDEWRQDREPGGRQRDGGGDETAEAER